MAVAKPVCDLCGMPITHGSVDRTIDGQAHHFCCEGCARVYTMAHDKGVLADVLPAANSQSHKIGFTDVIVTRPEVAGFTIGGMWCAGCAVAAEQLLRKQPGVKEADVSFAAERGRLEYDPQTVDPAALLRQLDGLGYETRLVGADDEHGGAKQEERLLLQFLTSFAFGMQVMLLYLTQLYPRYALGQFADPGVRRIQYLVWVLATPAFIVGGSTFLRGAWRALRARTATMDTLVALGIVSAYSYSVYVAVTGTGQVYFDSVVMITTFIMLGRYLEKAGGKQARRDIQHLLTLQPDRARRQAAGTWDDIDAATLTSGDVILVKDGERLPADIRVIDGHASVDESTLTGEATPIDKTVGDLAFAGTLSVGGAMTGSVLSGIGDSRLAGITRLVEQTLASKPPIQRLADRVSTYFAVGIAVVALLTWAAGSLAGRSPGSAVLAAVAVLVVACPCALGLATPLALAVSLGRATGMGILVRNASALETAARTQRVVFDKTGTLTQGKMRVTVSRPAAESGLNPEELTCLAAQVEQYSGHPIARAIVKSCPVELPPATDYEGLRGMGASANVPSDTGERVHLGSAELVHIDAEAPLALEAGRLARQGQTIVWVGRGGRVVGYLALRDEPDPKAPTALARLIGLGLSPVMLSGDDAATTAAIAAELNLPDYEGDCPPEKKAERIGQWQARGERVAMVGDGVNDAPALAQADLSITVSGGTDVAGETSDVVLTRSDLDLVPELISLSRRTRRIIIENLGWAFAYNLVSVPLAALGVVSPAIAAGAMATSSLLVVGNSLRLRR